MRAAFILPMSKVGESEVEQASVMVWTRELFSVLAAMKVPYVRFSVSIEVLSKPFHEFFEVGFI